METKNHEADKGYAHSVANYLNQLIDQKILTTHDVSNAGDYAIEEVVLRIHKGNFHPSVSRINLEEKEKLRTIFSSENSKSIDFPNKSEITEFVTGFIEYLKPLGYEEITGALVYGSLLDKRKKPRLGSDLDVMFLVNTHRSILFLENTMLQEGDPIDSSDIEVRSHYEDITEMAFEFADKKFPKFKNISLNLSHVFNQELFMDALDPKDKDEAPWWLYSPGVYAVGGFVNMSEQQVNLAIQKALSSDWLKKLKQETIDKIKKNLKWNFGK